ncbi:hypothetical protein M0805_008454 [Coniferiporia weirii]|nr:hypothetical protein M0805_008454 [Coniferiporia weirii]
MAIAPVNAVAPTNNNTYAIMNLGFSHWLDNSEAGTDDGNFILAWQQNIPTSPNQKWIYLSYPSSNGDTVFTLQSVSTYTSQSLQGGYVRVDTTTNRLVQGGAPMAWKLVESSPNIYSMTPFDDIISGNGSMVATDIDSAINGASGNQVMLVDDNSGQTQLWAFNLV